MFLKQNFLGTYHTTLLLLQFLSKKILYNKKRVELKKNSYEFLGMNENAFLLSGP